jgi:phosphopantetheinyl transferase
VVAGKAPYPIGIDVEASGERLARARRRFAGPADTPVLDRFGDDLDTLCRLWTAKEAAFKVFGKGLDFLTGLEWRGIQDDHATVWATVQSQHLDITWRRLVEPDAWLAVATCSAPPLT